MKFLILGLSSLPFFVFAAEKHVHGAADLSIAFDGPQGKAELRAPSETFFGFEHAAKTAADKKTVEMALKKLENNISEMISFHKDLNCKFTKDKVDVDFDSKNHSTTTAIFAIKCDKSPVGSKMTFNFQKFFPGLKDIDAQILTDDLQKSAEIKANGHSLELGK